VEGAEGEARMENFDPTELQHLTKQFSVLRGRQILLEEQIDRGQSSIASLTEKLEDTEVFHIVAQEIARKTMAKIEFQISSIVTAALNAVFPDPPGFEVKFEKARNQLECYIWFNIDGQRTKPIDTDAGGALDVTAFALRLTYWSLRKNRPTFILDEPFKYVSVDLQEKCAAMIKMLSDKMGVQIIMVSHLPNINITADKEYRVEKKGRKSIVREVK
jgi:DNA repair ATPase RecN